MYDDAAFIACLKRKRIQKNTVAAAMGIDTSTLYRKRKGEAPFTLKDIEGFLSLFTKKDTFDVFFRQGTGERG